MSISKDRIFYLLDVYSKQKATDQEEQELFNWVETGDERLVKKHIGNLLSSYDSGSSVDDRIPDVDWERLYQQILQEKNSRSINPIVHKLRWYRLTAAAVVFLLLGASYYFLTNSKIEPKNEIVIEQPKTNDILPPNRVNAVLTLGNGRKIILDSTGNGMLAMQGSVNVIKLADGQISYSGTSHEIQYNTLSNPKGSKVINLVLADGSKIWLNAASSLKYPTVFAGSERKVEVTGEAYLEVAHNPDMPFIVTKGNTSIKVLGTHFNVNAYDDESSLNVTLLEGSVSVATKENQPPKLIKPGEQAQVNKNGSIELANSVDLNEVIAWKNGIFSFKGANIQTIMRQIARWYDVEVVFEKPVDEKFYAEVSRGTSASVLLNMLEATKAVRFKIEGKRITVMPSVLP